MVVQMGVVEFVMDMLLKISEYMVSIITVNYNGWKDTCELIASLKKYERYPYEVIVVDNASAGDDVQEIRVRYPDVNVICNDQNLGFAGGNNLGYQYAKGDYLLFLNNDIIVKSSILEPMVRRLQNPAIGGVSPMIRFSYPPYDVQYYGHQKMTPITLKHSTPAYDVSHPEKYLKDREVEVMHAYVGSKAESCQFLRQLAQVVNNGNVFGTEEAGFPSVTQTESQHQLVHPFRFPITGLTADYHDLDASYSSRFTPVFST